MCGSFFEAISRHMAKLLAKKLIQIQRICDTRFKVIYFEAISCILRFSFKDSHSIEDGGASHQRQNFTFVYSVIHM